jgi:OOP family OmpA-OmpF porin
MRSRLSLPALALAAAGLLASLASAGCGGVIAVTTSSSCAWTKPGAAGTSPDTTAATSNTVVLIDTSASYWPKQGTSKALSDDPDQAALNALVADFGTGGTRLVSLGTFNGSSATVSWQLGDVPLPIATGSGQQIQGQLASARTCLGNLVGQAEQTSPQAPGTDVMGALGSAAAELGVTPAARGRVTLITDGLSNTGCLNLNQVLAQGQTAADIVRACGAQSGLGKLVGVSVQLVGVGFQALYPAMSTSEQDWLQNYWRELCTALKVQSPASCVAAQTSDGARDSTVSRLADAPVRFPAVRSDISVPAPLLFAFNSDVLTPTAQSYLNILIQKIRSQGRSVAKVVGHTDRVGSAAYNKGLSQRRATAVQAYLAAHGFTGIAASGVGFSQPACPDEYLPSGQPNPACMARDRRVEIILGGSSA